MSNKKLLKLNSFFKNNKKAFDDFFNLHADKIDYCIKEPFNSRYLSNISIAYPYESQNFEFKRLSDSVEGIINDIGKDEELFIFLKCFNELLIILKE